MIYLERIQRFDRGIANAALSQLSYIPNVSNNRKKQGKQQNRQRQISADFGKFIPLNSAPILPL